MIGSFSFFLRWRFCLGGVSVEIASVSVVSTVVVVVVPVPLVTVVVVVDAVDLRLRTRTAFGLGSGDSLGGPGGRRSSESRSLSDDSSEALRMGEDGREREKKSTLKFDLNLEGANSILRNGEINKII
jgi:hypothetical protein